MNLVELTSYLVKSLVKDPDSVSVKEMLEEARKITGKEIPADFVERRPGDPAELVATSAYAREKLGWKPEYSDVHTLLDSTWKAYLANGKLKK